MRFTCVSPDGSRLRLTIDFFIGGGGDISILGKNWKWSAAVEKVTVHMAIEDTLMICKELWMRLKKIWALMLALILVTGFVYAEGATEEGAMTAEGPQYGGTFTIAYGYTKEAKNWDVPQGAWNLSSERVYPIYSFLLIGDVETFGPRGTDEYAFQIGQEIPEQFLRGDLAESWEVNADGLSFVLKKGIMYTGNDHIGMEPREVTAQDMVAGMKYILTGPLGEGSGKFVKDIRATGRYTFEVDFDYYDFLWGANLIYGMGCVYFPPEVIEAGAADWRNHAGSGPFILTDYVSGAGATYKRNPDYYGTTTIDGTEYKTPFVDKLVYPTIADQLTMVGAFRTGKIDLAEMSVQYVESLAETNPELVVAKYVSSGMVTLSHQIASPPWDNMLLRQASQVAIDMQGYVDTVLRGEGFIHPFPSPGSPYYTPIEDMPMEMAALFSGDKELAKKMMADAGYPDGLKTKLLFRSSVQRDADAANFLASDWAKVGIEVELVPMETTVHTALRFSRDFDGVFVRGDANGATTELPQRKTDCAFLASSWNNAEFDAMMDEAQKMTDPVERAALMKEAGDLFTWEVGNINLPAGMSYKYWWPWVNNYYGEEDAGFRNHQPMINRLWIDQAKKKSMGK